MDKEQDIASHHEVDNQKDKCNLVEETRKKNINQSRKNWNKNRLITMNWSPDWRQFTIAIDKLGIAGIARDGDNGDRKAICDCANQIGTTFIFDYRNGIDSMIRIKYMERIGFLFEQKWDKGKWG